MKRKLLPIILFFILCVSLVKAQWQQTSLTGKSVVSMTAVNNYVFAGTYQNGVYVSSDDGTTWTQMNNGLNNVDVWGLASSGTTVYAGTGNGAYMTTDYGVNWTSISNGLAGIYAIYDFVFMGSDIFVGTLSNVYKTSDNGANWNYSGTGNFSSTFLVGDGSNLYAGFPTNGGVSYSTDNGATWTARGLSTYPIRAMGVNGQNLFTATSDSIYYSSDAGANWSPRINGITTLNRWTLCFLPDGNRMFAGTRGGGVYVTYDNGSNWTFNGQGLPPGSYENKLVISGNYIFAGLDYQQGVWRRALSQISAVSEMENKFSINVYPNPSVNELRINNTEFKIKDLAIFDVLGNKIYSSTIAHESPVLSINVSDLVPGIYFISCNKSAAKAKFVVQR